MRPVPYYSDSRVISLGSQLPGSIYISPSVAFGLKKDLRLPDLLLSLVYTVIMWILHGSCINHPLQIVKFPLWLFCFLSDP